MDWVIENIAIIVPALIAVASAVSAFVPSTNKVMQIIDLIAINWGKARNDPGVQ
jgi:hypothetical protein